MPGRQRREVNAKADAEERACARSSSRLGARPSSCVNEHGRARSPACTPEAASPVLTSTGASELVREQARTHAISGTCTRGIVARSHVHGRVRARTRPSTAAHHLGRVRPRRPRPSSHARAGPSSCANEHGRARSRARTPEASSPELTSTGASKLVRERARTRAISGACARGVLAQGLARSISISESDVPRQHPGGDRRPNDRALPCGRAADAIDSKSRSRGAGNRTSIPASRQWAEIHIARLGTGAGGGTDPRTRIEAADPINSARCRRLKP